MDLLPVNPVPALPPPSPVVVHISDDHGYVWDAVAARQLREHCRIVGAMVGALAGFRQQDAVHGMPLQLTPEELTLAASKGWVTLTTADPPAAAADAPPPVAVRKPVQKKKMSVTWNSMALRKNTAAAIASAEAARGRVNDAINSQPWKRLALSDGERVSIAITTQPAGPDALPPPPQWTFPQTLAESIRYRVFLDLHTRGFTLTSGAKFGGDYLAYPGDPALYHAQYTVRCVHHSAPQHPLALAAATRMAHAARKHVLLASVQPAEGGVPLEAWSIHYLTFAPDIMQSSNKERMHGAHSAAPQIILTAQ